MCSSGKVHFFLLKQVVKSASFQVVPWVHTHTHRRMLIQSFFNIYFYGISQWKSAVVQLTVSLERQSPALYTAQWCCAAERGGEWGKQGGQERRERWEGGEALNGREDKVMEGLQRGFGWGKECRNTKKKLAEEVGQEREERSEEGRWCKVLHQHWAREKGGRRRWMSWGKYCTDNG